MSLAKLCKSCRAGDCPDCIRHLFAEGGCEHVCDNDVQLGLFELGQLCRRAEPAGQADVIEW